MGALWRLTNPKHPELRKAARKLVVPNGAPSGAEQVLGAAGELPPVESLGSRSIPTASRSSRMSAWSRAFSGAMPSIRSASPSASASSFSCMATSFRRWEF